MSREELTEEQREELEARAAAKEQELRRRQAKLSAVARHPEWPTYTEELLRKARREERKLVKRYLAGETISEEERGYVRGMAAALRYMAKLPVVAEESLSEALQRADAQRALDEELEAAWQEVI